MFGFFKRKKNKSPRTNNESFMTSSVNDYPKENNSFQEMKEKTSEISDNVQESTSEISDNVQESTSDILDDVKESAGETLSDAKESAENALSDVQEKTSDIIDNFKNDKDEDINDDVSSEEKELSEELTTTNSEKEFENENEDLGEYSGDSNEPFSEVISEEYVPEDPEDDNTSLSEEHLDEEDIAESVTPDENEEETTTEDPFVVNEEEAITKDPSVVEEEEDNEEEITTEDPFVVNEEEAITKDPSVVEEEEDNEEEAITEDPSVVEDNEEETIALFPVNDVSVEESEIDNFIEESKDVDDIENNDDSQFSMNFDSISSEENGERDTLDIDQVQNQENHEEEKELRKSVAFNVQKLINNKTYPLILAIKENDDAIKEELSSIIGTSTVFLVDFTESRNGYKVIPSSANREFAPINNEGDSSYLDGIDIINLIKNSGDKYDGSFIIIAGIDNITNKVSHALSGNQIAIDMIYEKIKTSIREAVENNITVIGTGYELNEPLSDFIDKLSLEDIIEDQDFSEENDSIVPVQEKEIEDGDENIAEHTEYNLNESVDKEEHKPEEIISETTIENNADVIDNDNRNTVDEYLKSMGKSSIEEGIDNKNNDSLEEEE